MTRTGPHPGLDTPAGSDSTDAVGRRSIASRASGEAARLDAFKGVFIVLVVLGHNHTMALEAGEVRGALYLFHVAMFLYLPFLRERRSWNAIGWGDCLVRYGWPMTIFSLLYAGLFAVFSGGSPVQAVLEVPCALAAMSARVFESVTGLQILWFLPALIGLRLTLKALGSPHAPPIRILLLPAFLLHLGIGLLPEAWLRVTPFGWPIVAYLLFPGLLVHLLDQAAFRIPLRQVVPALLLVGLLAYTYRMSGPVLGTLPSGPIFTLGKLDVPSIAEPVRLLSADAAQVIVLFAAMALCGLTGVQALFSGLGRESFAIYLFHQPIYIALLGMTGKLGWRVEDVATGVILLACTLAVSFATALLLGRVPRLHRFVFPGGLPRRLRPGPARTRVLAAPASEPPAVR